MAGIIGRVRRPGVDFWLLLAAVLLGLCVVWQGIAWAGLDELAPDVSGGTHAGLDAERDAGDKVEQYMVIGRKGHFGQQKQRELHLFGILGQEALIGRAANDAKFHGVGAGLSDGWKLTEIGLDSVVIEKEGNKKTLTLWPKMGSGGGGRGNHGPRPGPPTARRAPTAEPAEREKPTEAPPQVEVQTQSRRNRPQRGARWEQFRQRIEDRLQNMPPEERARMRERMEEARRRWQEQRSE